MAGTAENFARIRHPLKVADSVLRMFFVRAVRYDILQPGAQIRHCSAQPSIYYIILILRLIFRFESPSREFFFPRELQPCVKITIIYCKT